MIKECNLSEIRVSVGESWKMGLIIYSSAVSSSLCDCSRVVVEEEEERGDMEVRVERGERRCGEWR